MNNNQLLPFERNRYYSGKMLTSTDFQAEQLYMNNKRRFLNQVLFGHGVVCGLNITNLDDLSILVENGVAIDSKGREIIVPSSVVKKLSAIQGFEQLSGDIAVLKIKFCEELTHPVYSITAKDIEEEYQFNRMQETYELYLDNPDGDYRNGESKNYLQEELLIDHEDFRVTIKIPYIIIRGKAVKIIVSMEKKTENELSLSFCALLQLPAFFTEDKRKELKIEVANLFLPKGEILEQEYWIETENVEIDKSTILIKRGSAFGTVGNDKVEINDNLIIKINMSNLDLASSALKEIGKVNYDQRIDANIKDIELARFQLLRTGAAYVISNIIDCKHYISAPYGSQQRLEYRSYFKDNTKIYSSNSEKVNSIIEKQIDGRKKDTAMASGIVEIPLNVDMKKGEICFSEEIMHGLGKGNVYVSAGVQFIETDNISLRDCKSTIYGEANLFQHTEHMCVQTAVKVFHNKGSFQIAAKLLEEKKSIILVYNWIAIKFLTEEESRFEEDQTEWNIVAQTPTVSIGVRESYSFHVKFENMKPCRLTYELTESASGEITSDGVYTAPVKEGVYEIHIFCTDFPQIHTFAYAIVKK